MNERRPMIIFTLYSPYSVVHMKEVGSESGKTWALKEVTSLCRCGASHMKPYCDGSHSGVNFNGEKSPDRIPDRPREYRGDNITVVDNRGVCSHDGECIRTLPSVFRIRSRPWVDPGGDTVQRIVETVEMCPSGALSYKIGFTRHQELHREPAIIVEPGGPYNVQGGIELIDDMGSVPESREHYCLCRCGGSLNKPFCDGSHREIHFDTKAEKEGELSPGESAPDSDD